MSVSDDKLKKCLTEAMKLDLARLEEEMKYCEPHVFSKEFEQKAESLFTIQQVEKKPCLFRKKMIGSLKYIAALLVVSILVGGTFVSQQSNAKASALNIDIQAWFDKFFTVEDGDVGKAETDTLLFEESQIGFLPEGFEKVSEGESFSVVQYKYENETEDYIFIRVYRDKMLSNIDNESADKEVYLNAAGYEYTIVRRENIDEITIMWKDERDIYYYIESSLSDEESIKIMDGISY